MRIAIVFLVSLLLAVVVGCESPQKRVSLASELSKLKKQNRQCQSKLDESQKQTEQLNKQLAVLSEQKSGLKLASLYNLRSIRLAKYTGIYDEDEGKKKNLIVYVEPIDQQGDSIKATGAADVQLWDLNKPEHALLAQWHVGPEELRQMWIATMFSINYRLIFDVTEKIADAKGDLIVKVTFTDHIFGKVFTEQTVIKPK